MARLLGILVVVVALVAGSSGRVSAQAPGGGQDPVAGARVFDAKGCAKCHALDGSGGKTGPDLARIPKPHSFYDLAAAMWKRPPR
jgi:cytochrome c2